MAPTEISQLAAACKAKLDLVWGEVVSKAERGLLTDAVVDEELQAAIAESVNSNTKSYRYVLPTQVLAKAVDPTLDSRSLQVASGGKGAFDARSVCHGVLVPFDRENGSVLGGSSEPYVNNPLRKPAIRPEFGDKQRDRAGWDNLCRVLDAVENKQDPTFTEKVLLQVFIEVHRRLSETAVLYPVPKRISLDDCIRVINSFLAERSGGDRALAVTAALFQVIGQAFSLYYGIRRSNINAADASSGQAADIECLSETGEVALVVEVKDREITVGQIKDKLSNVRTRKIAEMLFIAQNGIAAGDEEEVRSLIRREFSSGQNVYIFTLVSFARSTLALLGERGRSRFLDAVGAQLDAYASDVRHRKAWAELLCSV